MKNNNLKKKKDSPAHVLSRCAAQFVKEEVLDRPTENVLMELWFLDGAK